MRAPEGKREIGEQRLGLARGQHKTRARIEPRSKATEERELQLRHTASGVQTIAPFDATFDACHDGS